MAINTIITITSNDTASQMQQNLQSASTSKYAVASALDNYFEALAGGMKAASLDIQVDGGDSVAASGTLTLTSVVATNTCVINGVTFTAIASGAVGNQFNVGVSNTATAVNLAAAISASVTALVSGVVTATSALGVVTVSATAKGTSGNLCTLTGSANIAASGARLTGGTASTANSVSFGF